MDIYNIELKRVRQLKVGDLVCDCRYKHLRIKELTPRYMTWESWIARQIIFCKLWPQRFTDALEIAWRKITNVLGIKEFIDYDVMLEDGNCCSAFHCLSAVDHEECEHQNVQR